VERAAIHFVNFHEHGFSLYFSRAGGGRDTNYRFQASRAFKVILIAWYSVCF
jgi:hypothetical protein